MVMRMNVKRLNIVQMIFKGLEIVYDAQYFALVQILSPCVGLQDIKHEYSKHKGIYYYKLQHYNFGYLVIYK